MRDTRHVEFTTARDAVEDDNPNVTIVASEVFSAQIPGRLVAGKVDVGIARLPEPMRGVGGELLRVEPLVLLVGKRHRLADPSVLPLVGASLASRAAGGIG